MAKAYEKEFKAMIVELLDSGRTVKEISVEYQLNDSLLRRWRREHRSNAGDPGGRKELTAEEAELRELRKALKEVTLERDILKKAVSIFSKTDR